MDVSCNNQDLEGAYYPNILKSDPSGLDPTLYKTQNPTVQGVTASAGGFQGICADKSRTFNFYGQDESCEYFVIDHRGHLYAAQTGNFAIWVLAALDLVLVWAGADAYTRWTRSNALIDATGQLPAGGITKTYIVTRGDYVPLRILFADSVSIFYFSINITAPDGSIVFKFPSPTSNFVVTHSCDGAAPAYPPFGAET